ncbi:SLC13 family permease [Aureibaculum sp. 2210JD6-5]|uniref:SLC13 family permease n=1 Tax=Aureibaculum sp. 2210JD6-5 TaxID=3103957 RepID=UPI002AAD6C56|nr:SLC13 family permease [Aureibaculum sp. 2210JD6-5]MDY7394452.1 SLC13 family permease [Aureibaculum sp. 2210JD6-5]
MPISFAGILGGSCTLMGTSTNLLVNSVAIDLGATRLGFFEFSMLGLIFLGISIIYLTIIIRWLPWDKQKNFSEDYKINSYITQIKINKDSDLIGKTIDETFIYNEEDISLLKLTRNKKAHNSPGKYITLKENDELLITTDLENLTKLNDSKHLTIHQEKFIQRNGEKLNDNTEKPKDDDKVFVELLMLPGALLLGKKIGELYNFMITDAIPIAIKKRKTFNINERLFLDRNKDNITLEAGDRLLVQLERENVQSLEEIENIVVLKELESLQVVKPFKKYFSLIVLLGVITLAATGILTILVSALTGVAVLLLTNTLDLNNVYKKVNWQIFFLLAGMIPLGIAMHNSGADTWISEKLLGFLSGQSKIMVIGTLFLATMVMSGVISNNATAIIMTPIAISVAQGLNMDFKAFILAIMFAANFSFFTPVGYQTNTLVYGIGDYKFKHFFLIGGLLSLILWITATLLLTKYY